MSFSTKSTTQPTSSESNTSPEQWEAWYDYYYGLFGGTEKQSTRKDGSVIDNQFFKKSNLVGINKGIIDIGTQKQRDSLYDSKCALPEEGEENSAEELAHMEKYKGNYFIWEDGKRKQGKPEQPAQEYVLLFDFPKVMIDWTKHPIEAMHRLGTKPLRVSVNGSFYDHASEKMVLGKRLALKPHWKTKKLSPNNPLMKIAGSCGVAQEFEASEYDLGTLVGAACKWDVTVTTNKEKGRVYNPDIKNHSEITEVVAGDMTITVEQQIPECNSEFIGILMNEGEYPDDTMEYLSHKNEILNVLPNSVKYQPSPEKYPDFYLGVEWEESDLCKALGEYQKKSGSSKTAAKEKATEQPKRESVKESKPVQSEPPMDFCEDIPFSPVGLQYPQLLLSM